MRRTHRVVAAAKPGEQIEAYVSRGGETAIRVYEGEVEHFVSAQSEGVGIRVIKDGRTGFAYAGTLDPSAIAEVLADARDNVAFGTADQFAGLAIPAAIAYNAFARASRNTMAELNSFAHDVFTFLATGLKEAPNYSNDKVSATSERIIARFGAHAA